MEKVRCNNTMKVYTEEELVLVKTEIGGETIYYNGCPCCGTDEYLMDIDEE